MGGPLTWLSTQGHARTARLLFKYYQLMYSMIDLLLVLPYTVGGSAVETTVPQPRRLLSFGPLGIRLPPFTDPASAVTALTPPTAVRVSLAQNIRDVIRLRSPMPHE